MRVLPIGADVFFCQTSAVLVVCLVAMASIALGDEGLSQENLGLERKLPFYQEEEAPLLPAISPVQATTAQRTTVDSIEAGKEQPVLADPLPARTKTPLPDWDQPDSGSNTPASAGRSGFGTSLLWVTGLLAAGWLATKYLQTNGTFRLAPSSPLEILSRQSVGPQQQLILARLGQQVLLIGATPSGMSTLASVSDPVEAARLLEELRPANPPAGPTVLDLFRSRRTEAAPLAGASLTTAPLTRSAPSHQPRSTAEVADV